MTVSYKFSSLASLADYIEISATRKRDMASTALDARKGLTKQRRAILLAEAAAHESDAHVIRSCTIEENDGE